MIRAAATTTARLLPIALALLWANPAIAQQSGLDLSAQASASQVEVGEPFTIQLKALSDQNNSTASDPELKAPSNFTVTGPQISSQSFMQLGPGGTVVRTGIGATWQLIAANPGSFMIQGPSVVWRGKRTKTNDISIEVVPASGRPRRQSPFLFPGGSGFNFPSWPFGQAEPSDDDRDDTPNASQDLAMSKAPDPNLFLRAVADKSSAVVGEQVTISFYVYYRVDFEMTDRREAPLADFLRVSLLKNPGADPPVYAVVEGRRYLVRLLDRIAVFPIRAGELHTGSMSARFTGRRVGANRQERSNDIVVNASEPPREGRPPGYSLGDVGQFSLSALVEPRKVDQGGSVAVTLRVQGKGNFPQSLRVPERTGLEWLDPEKRESIESIEGQVGGYRSFGYVVRVNEAGPVTLGKVSLPYWDPESKSYEVASADLGTIQVRPAAAAAAPGTSAQAGKPGEPADASLSSDSFASLAPARLTLGAYASPAPSRLDGSRFWWLLAAPPALYGLFLTGARAARAMRARRAASKTSPVTLAERALRDADAASKSGDKKALASSLERAIHSAIEQATDLRARGVLLSDLPAELSKRGLPDDLSRRACDVLSACETIRFDPTASSEAIHDLRDRAAATARELLRWKAA